jgi:hypothetical protein
MNEKALSMFIDQVLADAERKFGPDADPIWLESYAREAVLDLWLELPEITFFTAYKAFLRLREEIAVKTGTRGEDSEIQRPAQKPRTSETPPRLRSHPCPPVAQQHALGPFRNWQPEKSNAQPASDEDEIFEWSLDIA